MRAVYDLSFVYITPASSTTKPSQGQGVEQAGQGGKSARVPSLAELVGVRDLSREGYEFLIHVRRYVDFHPGGHSCVT